jgi:Ca2+-binding RTX toxin-like protein
MFLSCTSASNGTCTVSYASTKAGDDYWRAWIDSNGNNSPDEADTNEGKPGTSPSDVDETLNPGATAEPDGTDAVFARWTAAAPTPAAVQVDMVPQGSGTDDTGPGVANTKVCNANLSDFSDSTGTDAWNATDDDVVNSINLVCASAKDAAGNVLYGQSITLTSSGAGVLTDPNGPPPGVATQTAAIGSDGYAEFYVFSTVVGTQAVTATAGSATKTGTETWDVPVPAEARTIACLPKTESDPVRTNHDVTCTVTDGLTNAVPGVAVTWTKTDAGGATSSFVFQSTTTDANGHVSATITSTTTGTTTLQGGIAAASTECGASANGPGPLDQGKPAGKCTDSVTKTWVARAATTLTLAPKAATNRQHQQHTVTAVVVDQVGDPVAGALVRFGVTGANPGTGMATTDAAGSAAFTYTGENAGDDAIAAYVDLNANGAMDAGEPTDTAAKTWTAVCPGFENDPRAQIVGTQGDDRLVGTAESEVICGLGGNDVLIGGGGGSDLLLGGPGADTLRGGEGADLLKGGGGADILRGGDGNDVLKGGLGNDSAYGEFGNDILTGGPGNDLLKGGPGNDAHDGGPGKDSCYDRIGRNTFVSC